MSFADQIKEKLDQARKRAWAPFQPVPQEVLEQRLSHCHRCENYTSAIDQCQLCFCIMSQKAKLTGSRCPAGYWNKHEISDQKPGI